MLGRMINIFSLLIYFSISACWYLLPCSAKAEKNEYPDIKWEPKTYLVEPGSDPRYIDYENGDDNNDGTKEKPWRHHPWDEAAKGKAADCTGIYTYIFKNGSVYRGTLVAKESGRLDDPIILTSDPTWGYGKASLYGSVKIEKGWIQCNDIECAKIPPDGRNDTWYIDLDNSFTPRMLWEIHDNQIIRIPLARTPNWEIIDRDDPRSEWWELTGYILEVKIYLDKTDGFKMGDSITGTGKWTDFDVNRDNVHKGSNRITKITKEYIKIDSSNWKKGEIKVGEKITNGRVWATVTKMPGAHDVISRLVDNKNLTQHDPKYWVGATMWSEKESMPKPDAEKVTDYNPAEHSLKINYHRGTDRSPRTFDRYYLENLPNFLDSPGEYYYEEKGKYAGRLFIHLPQKRDPNASVIEAAKENIIVDISDQNYITISKLDFKFSNAIEVGTVASWHASLNASSIRISGNCSNIRIVNSKIEHAPAGIVAHSKKKGDKFDFIEIINNNLNDIDGVAIGLSNGRYHAKLRKAGARLIHVKVINNLVKNVGYRNLNYWGLSNHAIHIDSGELIEVSHNVVDQCWGAGILVFNGSDYSTGNIERPLLRTLIHHNKVTNSLLGLQDYGGISSWNGGPSYVYSNISGNPVGYKNAHYKRNLRKGWYRNSCFGAGIYFDGQYKGYAFNNIIWGKNNNVNDRIYNSVGFNEAMGFMNTVFNNTLYRFGVGFHKDMTQHNRCNYIGNLIIDAGHKFIQHEPRPALIEYKSLAYTNNIFNGEVHSFGKMGRENINSLEKWQNILIRNQAMVPETGLVVKKIEVRNASTHDFRLRPGAISIDKGAKVFVPWGLYRVVGEWNFFYQPHDPTVVLGEHMNWNNEWFSREMFQDIPRNDLRAHNIEKTSFVQGPLEGWTKGALTLNGKNQYLDISNDLLTKGYNWSAIRCKKEPCAGFFDGSKRVAFDMDINNFLVEIFFKVENGHVNSGIVSKRTRKGYSFEIEKNGSLILKLNFGRSECLRQSEGKVNDGKWHHVIAEVDRSKPEGINIYIDGKLSNGNWKGAMNNSDSLSNNSNFTVGKTLGNEENYFRGVIDFLRISRGTLKDAETTIEELYQWEFDGPFLKDFNGKSVIGKYRDVGAIEYK